MPVTQIWETLDLSDLFAYFVLMIAQVKASFFDMIM